MQLFKLSVTDKETVLNVGMKGVNLAEGLGNIVVNGQPTKEMKIIKKNTLIIINGFNIQTKQVILQCIKDLDNYIIEVPYKFIVDNCVFESLKTNKPIDMVYVKYYIQNVMDKDTAMFVLVMVLTYVCGLFIGRVL